MGKYVNMFKGAAVTGAGLSVGMLPQMLLGLAILVIGFVIFNRQNKVRLFGGIGLMLLGAGIGMGMGLGLGLHGLADQL